MPHAPALPDPFLRAIGAARFSLLTRFFTGPILVVGSVLTGWPVIRKLFEA